MMGQTTVALMTAALAHATVLGVSTHPVATAPRDRVAFTDVAMSFDEPAPGRGRVSGISIAPSATGADILIALDAAVTVRHFTLEGPSRLVIDLGDASIAMRGLTYDGQTRGPIRNLRVSQFRSDTVRLVIDLDTAHEYKVAREGDHVRLTVQGASVAFARWESVVSHSAASQVAAGRLDVPVLSHTDDSTAKQRNAPHIASKAEPKPESKPMSAAATEAAAHAVAQTAARADLTPMSNPGSQKMRVDAERYDARGNAPIASAQQPTTRRQQKPRITVNYDGTDIRDVIAVFATFSGRSIIVGKDVQGTVTADVRDKPWDVALQAILQGQGLAAIEDASGIITVDTYKNLASNQSLEPMITQIIDVNYAKAYALRTTIQALLARDCTGLSTMQTGVPMNQGSQGGQSNGGSNNASSGQGCTIRGSVTADSTTNKLIITEVPSRLPEIIARIAELDIRTQQVAIKAKIIFVNRTGIQEIGLAYDLGTGNKQFFQQLVPRTDPNTLKPIDTNGDGVPDAIGGGTPFEGPARIALGGNAISGIANANNAIKPNALNLIYSTALGRYQLTAFLNALQTSSLADVQSEPSITILNNRSAEIFVGQEIPIRVIDASSGGSGGGGGGGAGGSPNAAAFFPRATVSKEEAGIKLSVTPQITNNRMVLLNIKAENSSAEISSTDVGVIFNRQRAESMVLVADGEAAVIGGLTVTETTRFRSGIPVLMNLPFIGRLFSQNSKNEKKRDLLILVTPHILEDGPPPPPGR